MAEESRKMRLALEKYLGDFLSADGKKMAELAGGRWQSPNILLPFLNQEVAVNTETGAISPEPPTILERILILKYLQEAQGMTGPDTEYIAFRQLTAGSHHQNAFKAEVTDPLAQVFGADLECFSKVAESFGGVKTQGGDLAYTISYFPKISLHVMIWEGDDEFPAQCAFLFDKKSQFHMDTDGLNELANSMAALLLEAAKA